jgi:AcrR family transcriptional regulator
MAAHGLVERSAGGREGVVDLQRARLTGSMTELVRERGGAGVTVAHVVARSGVSRRTFYELFEDREACFLAAFDRALAGAGERTLAAYAAPARWNDRVRAGIEALLGFFDEEPAMGFLCVVGALGAGGRALERRAEVIAVLVDAVHEGRREARAGRRINRLVAEGVVGAVLAVLHTRLQERDGGPLLALLNPLMSIVVLPYLGPAAAERELARAAPRTRRPARSRRDPLRDLQMRLTYRTVRVLLVIAASPAASNREVATAAGIADQGQISKLLARLQTLGLVENSGGDHAKGEPNAWSLTDKGWEVARVVDTQAEHA